MRVDVSFWVGIFAVGLLLAVNAVLYFWVGHIHPFWGAPLHAFCVVLCVAILSMVSMGAALSEDPKYVKLATYVFFAYLGTVATAIILTAINVLLTGGYSAVWYL